MFLDMYDEIKKGTRAVMILTDLDANFDDVHCAQLVACDKMLDGAKKGNKLETYIIRYNDMRYPENMEKICEISNNSDYILVVNKRPDYNGNLTLSPVLRNVLETIGKTVYMAYPIPYEHSVGSMSIPAPIESRRSFIAQSFGTHSCVQEPIDKQKVRKHLK